MNADVRRLARLIKNYRNIAFITFLAMVVLFYFVGRTPFFALYPYLVFPFFVIALFLIYLCFRQYRLTRLKAVESLLKEQCDPEAFLQVYGDFLRMLDGPNIKSEVGIYELRLGLEMYWLTLCEGIIALGDNEKALEILGDIVKIKPEKNGRLYRYLCLYNMYFAYRNNGDEQKASENYELLKESFEALGTKERRLCESGFNIAKASMQTAKGNFDAAKAALTEVYENAVNSYEAVCARYYLGVTCLESGDTKSAGEAFEYVSEHGNKLHIVKEAKQHLAKTI